MAGIFHIPISGFTQVKGEQNICFSIAFVTKGWGFFFIIIFHFSLLESRTVRVASEAIPFSWYLMSPWQLPLGSRVTGAASSAGQPMVEGCLRRGWLHWWAGNMSCDSSGFNTTPLLPLGSWSHGAGAVNLRLCFLSGCVLARGAQAFEVRKERCKHSVVSSLP